MRFLFGPELSVAINELVAGPKVSCAVAFLGKGATSIFPSGTKARIICNLASGGTNPHEIRELLQAGHEVRQHDRLHAKVYIGAASALVGSANLSANGLGLEDGEQARWIETGWITDEIGPIVVWFEGLWKPPATRKITETDFKEAEERWRRRRTVKPTLRSFADFDPMAKDMPLLESWNHGDFQTNRLQLKNETGKTGDAADDAVSDALEVCHTDDLEFMQPGTWVIWWRHNDDGIPHKSEGLQWGKCGPLVERAFRPEHGKGRWRDIVLTDVSAQPVPFDCADKIFSRLFKRMLTLPKYKNLRNADDGKPFFAPRMPLIRAFWKELKDEYNKQAV